MTVLRKLPRRAAGSPHLGLARRPLLPGRWTGTGCWGRPEGQRPAPHALCRPLAEACPSGSSGPRHPSPHTVLCEEVAGHSPHLRSAARSPPEDGRPRKPPHRLHGTLAAPPQPAAHSGPRHRGRLDVGCRLAHFVLTLALPQLRPLGAFPGPGAPTQPVVAGTPGPGPPRALPGRPDRFPREAGCLSLGAVSGTTAWTRGVGGSPLPEVRETRARAPCALPPGQGAAHRATLAPDASCDLGSPAYSPGDHA